MKAQRKDVCTQLLERYNADGEAFLQRILTGEESWVHHYDPECKAQSMEYMHKTSASSRLMPLQERSSSPVFRNLDQVALAEFLEQGQTVNSEQYISTFRVF
ncbi:histone-lysine N-methyltransferase SETMAR [Elysia marginata]|uniref:Histone-lysine N-methyltransferase SETMAR n=1 Tax=Elysia marginata TaxID=1093978 RepID=A0AAV4HJD3_9GAST|nr:histone-lysine N-methyltransferase SETMAR [Elysia marginata]